MSPSFTPICALTTTLSPKEQKALAPRVNLAPIHVSSTGLTVPPAQPGSWGPYFDLLALPLSIQQAQEIPSCWIHPFKCCLCFSTHVDKDSREMSTVISFRIHGFQSLLSTTRNSSTSRFTQHSQASSL